MKTKIHGFLFVFIGLGLLTAACKKQTKGDTSVPIVPVFTQSANIGNPSLQGSFTFNDTTGVYTLSGSGENIWYKSDQFFFVYEKVEGDFTLSSQVAFAPAVATSHPHRKIGLMIRETLDPASPHADVTVHFADGLTSLQYRSATGADMEENRLDILGAGSLVLQRQGGKIRVKALCNGQHPSEQVQSEIEMTLPASCYVGLFICSHDSAMVESACFSAVKLVK